ncbi:MAG: phytanoyl-CoA dioxygenase family protein [Rhodobacteraceae bacterium]|nr:phytanoyl-CoA dioxygenase family protein [Paracoccaceae bacterium]
MSASLSNQQRSSYLENGYIKPLRVMSERSAARLRAEIEAIEAKYPNGKLPAPLNQYFRYDGQLVMPFLVDVARKPVILDAVESLIGPNIMVWSIELFIKEAGSQAKVTWHQDLTYWGMGGTDLQVTAWIALTDVSELAGCMRFVPGSQKLDIVSHHDTFSEDNLLSRGQEIEVDVDENDAVLDDLRPGEMSLHHGKIFHASGPNNSDDRRIGLVIRYVSPEIERTGSGRDYAMLVRGIDQEMNWVNVAAPVVLFGQDELRMYGDVMRDKEKILAQDSEQPLSSFDMR